LIPVERKNITYSLKKPRLAWYFPIFGLVIILSLIFEKKVITFVQPIQKLLISLQKKLKQK